MSNETSVPSAAPAAQPRRTEPSLLNPTLKRKFGPKASGAEDFLYPSPPMSTSQSPPQAASEPPPSNIGAPPTYEPSRAAVTAPTTPALPDPAPTFPSSRTNVPEEASPDPQPLSAPPANPVLNHSASFDFSFKVLPPFSTYPTLTTIPSTRTGRKSKAHVAYACINCKRAHLSCDVQRPCGRCVASGKHDTCRDVPHKKRGRPRLRDDNGVKMAQGASDGSAAPAVGPPPSRQIAAPRHRRTDSSRSHTSFATDGAANGTLSHLPPPDMRSVQSYAPQFTSSLPPADIPTAFLDLDLVVLRANRPFKQIMSGGQEIMGHHISAIAVSIDTHRFEAIQAELLSERDSREPSYLPPILPLGQDPLQGVSEVDVDRLTYSFDDRTYTWARNSGRPMLESFPARVRLGKALSYFVVVTLPSFRPYVPMAVTPPVAAYAVPPPPGLPGRVASPFQFQGSQQPLSRRSVLYPPSQYSPSYPPDGPQSAPRLPPTEPPVQSIHKTPFYGRPSIGEVMSPVGLGVQLPPLGSSPYIPNGPFSRNVEPYRTSSTDENGHDAFPSKRRRVGMGIDEVLQP